MRARNIGVLVLTVEGIQQSSGGVGRYTQNLITDMPLLREHLRALGASVTFHFGEPLLAADDPAFDPGLWERSRSAVAAAGGTVTRLLNDSDGHVTWGSWAQFHALSATAAQLALHLVDRHDSLLVLSGTSAFALMPLLLLRQVGPGDQRFGVIHTHGAAIPWPGRPGDSAEILADSALATLARNDPRVRVASVSQFMARVFTDGYGIPDCALLRNITGIHRDDPRFERLSPPDRERRLARLGVPADRPLVLAWGRNSMPGLDKGYDLLLRACRRLGGNLLPVLMTRSRDAGLQSLADQLGIEAVLRYGQDFGAIAAVAQSPQTAAVVFAADSDPGAAGPLEAMRVAADGGSIVLAVDSGSYPEVVLDGRTGLLAERSDEALAARLGDAVTLPEAERARMRRAAARLVAAEHDFTTNVRDLLTAAIAAPREPAGR
jgi:glycosyltransferase involved in cell wall biosynthesis